MSRFIRGFRPTVAGENVDGAQMRSIPGVRSTALDSLRERDFRLIWTVGILGEFGRRYELLALSLLILEITESSAAHLMLLWVFNNLPRPFVSNLAGYLADRFSRHRVIFLGQCVNLATAAGLLGLMAYDLAAIQAWHILSVAFIQGTTRAVEDPSRRTGIFDIVGRDRIVNAMSLDVVAQNVGKMVGPVVGGLLLEFSGYPAAYSFLVFVHLVNLYLITRLSIPETGLKAAIPPMWRGLGGSVAFAWRNSVLVGMLSITLVMNSMAFPLQQFIPAVGTSLLEVGPALVGVLVAADGFGHLAGAAVVANRRGVRYHGRYFAYGSIVVLVTSAAYVWSPWYALAFLLLLAGGIGQSGFSTMQSSIMMLVAPPAMRGQMMGLLSFCIGIANLLGALELYIVVSIISLEHTITVHSLAGLVVLLPVIAFTPLAWRPLTQQSPGPSG